MPKKVKPNCQAEAENFAAAVQLVKASGKLPELIAAFESEDKVKFKDILDAIPGIDPKVKDKMNQGAHSNKTVSFNWF